MKGCIKKGIWLFLLTPLFHFTYAQRSKPALPPFSLALQGGIQNNFSFRAVFYAEKFLGKRFGIYGGFSPGGTINHATKRYFSWGGSGTMRTAAKMSPGLWLGYRYYFTTRFRGGFAGAHFSVLQKKFSYSYTGADSWGAFGDHYAFTATSMLPGIHLGWRGATRPGLSFIFRIGYTFPLMHFQWTGGDLSDPVKEKKEGEYWRGNMLDLEISIGWALRKPPVASKPTALPQPGN